MTPRHALTRFVLAVNTYLCLESDPDKPVVPITQGTEAVYLAADVDRALDEKDAALNAALGLIYGLVTGDGAQTENLDFDEAYWREMSKDGQLELSVSVECWQALVEVAAAIHAEPVAALTGQKKET